MTTYPYKCQCGYSFRPVAGGWKCGTGRFFTQAEIDEDHGPLVYFYDEESD